MSAGHKLAMRAAHNKGAHDLASQSSSPSAPEQNQTCLANPAVRGLLSADGGTHLQGQMESAAARRHHCEAHHLLIHRRNGGPSAMCAHLHTAIPRGGPAAEPGSLQRHSAAPETGQREGC